MADSPAFKTAAQNVRNLAGAPSNDEFSALYSLYKQATSGDCNLADPGDADPLVKAKYDAWMTRKGMSVEEAARQYTALAETAVTKYGVK